MNDEGKTKKAKIGKQLSDYHIRRIREKTLMDDRFMSVFFREFPEGVELVLQIILDTPDLKITEMKVQDTLSNLHGRNIIIDVYARDGNGTLYNVEIQKSSRGAGYKRARYHSSMLDANNNNFIGEEFEELPKTIVVFICENDIIGAGKPLYRINRVVNETGERFNDDAEIIYVNGKIKDSGTKLGRLMQDFFNPDPDKMNYSLLADKSRYLKTVEEGVEMVREFLTEEEWNAAVKQGKDIGIQQGIEQGIEKEMEQGIRSLVETCCELDVSADIIEEKLSSKYNLTSSEAKDYINKYACFAG